MPILFFLFPILGLYNGIKYFFQDKYRYGILFFAFWLGYSVFFYGGDISDYRNDFALFIHYSWSDLFHIYINFNNEDLKFLTITRTVYNSKPDFFAVTLGFIVSRFTENPRWFFAIVSVIYFYLMIKFFDEVIKFTGIVKSFGWRLFFAALVLIVPFYVGMTGIRFWPALFLFSWMLLKYINTTHIKYLFFTVFSIFFHYTFVFPVAIAFLAAFFKVNRNTIKILTIIGIVYAFLSTTTGSLDFIRNSLSYFDSDTINKATSSYLDEGELTKRTIDIAEKNWYVVWRVNLFNIYFFIFFIVDFFNFNNWNKVKSNLVFNNLYYFFFIVTLFTFNLGSLARFIYLFYFFVLIRILQLQKEDTGNLLKKWTYVFLPLLILHFFVTFRSGLYFIDPLLLISPSIGLLFVHSEMSLSQFLIGH